MDAQFDLGDMCHSGHGVWEPNHEKAAEWCVTTPTACGGVVPGHSPCAALRFRGMSRRGPMRPDCVMLLHVPGMCVSCPCSTSRYERAAQSADADPSQAQGENAAERSHVDAPDVFGVWRKQGHAEAQWRLGGMYVEGHGVEQSTTAGIGWITKAGRQGHPDAQANLGMRCGNQFEQHCFFCLDRVASGFPFPPCSHL